jgi:hypothetical protein
MTREQQLLNIKQVVLSLLHLHDEEDHRVVVDNDAAAWDRQRLRAQVMGSLRDAVEALAQNSDIPLHFYEFTDTKFLRSISPPTPISHPSPERG